MEPISLLNIHAGGAIKLQASQDPFQGGLR